MSLLSRRSVLKKTVRVGLYTLISRGLGFVREFLQVKYMGVSPVAEAFITAFRLPNSLRKIFAEGALTAAFVPTYVSVLKQDGITAASRLLTAVLCMVESIVLFLCFLCAYHASSIIYYMAPGWFVEPALFAEHIIYARLFLHILIFFIFFISTSSLLGGALNGLHHITIPANGQSVMNVLYIAELCLCLYFKLPVMFYAIATLCNGGVLVILHMYAYNKEGGLWLLPDRGTLKYIGHILKKFVPCLVSMGAVEINIFIDQTFASYLPAGSIAIFNYTWNFARIPIGVFAVAFSTILLPQFSRIHAYAPKRLGFYLFECIKTIAWVTIPGAIAMGIFSYKAFYTLFLSDQFTIVDVMRAHSLMVAFAVGVFFFCLNKIVLCMYYGMHETFLSTIISVTTTMLCTLLNWLFIFHLKMGVVSLAWSTTISAAVQSILLLVMLERQFGVILYVNKLWEFAVALFKQIFVLLFVGILCYLAVLCIMFLLPSAVQLRLLSTVLYWLWVIPLCAAIALLGYNSRKRFGIKLYFLD